MDPQNNAIVKLYQRLLDAWNDRDAAAYARLFSEKGNIVGFDGSTANGRAEIEAHLKPIFGDHPTARYVSKVRDVREISPGTALLRAVASMIPLARTTRCPNGMLFRHWWSRDREKTVGR